VLDLNEIGPELKKKYLYASVVTKTEAEDYSNFYLFIFFQWPYASVKPDPRQ